MKTEELYRDDTSGPVCGKIISFPSAAIVHMPKCRYGNPNASKSKGRSMRTSRRVAYHFLVDRLGWPITVRYSYTFYDPQLKVDPEEFLITVCRDNPPGSGLWFDNPLSEKESDGLSATGISHTSWLDAAEDLIRKYELKKQSQGEKT